MIQHFLDYIAIERKYSQRTVEAYRDDLRDFCRFLGWEPEEFDPERVGEDDVKMWMLDMLENQHQSRSTVKKTRPSGLFFLPKHLHISKKSSIFAVANGESVSLYMV